jgi:hypothetical protein
MTVDHDDRQREDPWAAARAAQRDDVRSVLSQRERHCPSCGAVQHGPGRNCPECGADLTARFARWRSLRKFVFAGAIVALIAAATLPLIAALRDDASEHRARQERRQAALREAERARQLRDARPVRANAPAATAAEDPLVYRAGLVARAEREITSDARARVAAGTLARGDIKGTDCAVFPATDARRAAERDPATAIGRYECVAYTSKLEGLANRTATFGHPFWLVIDYERGRLVWCKVTPRAGEGGSVLVSTTVPAPCRDPAGPG